MYTPRRMENNNMLEYSTALKNKESYMHQNGWISQIEC